ncbi:TonB-dependent receptor plug [gut metagenome]|uniref:TonB-dependent receptor plug n=1 Tax=gut metagenome TaxID=749906 RepID=J9FAM6_9ZZZZ
MEKKFLHAFLVCLFCLLAIPEGFAQQLTVTGKVIDATEEGMPGVNVQVKGTTTGTITDFDGNYSIQVPNAKATLVFSFIGYNTQEVAVGGKTVVNVVLKEDTQTLDEVVVVAYGTARKSDLTGATANLRPDANDASKTASFNNLLQGKVAGLNVTSSMATPGAASSVTIRGANSLRGDNQPLYVIDNVPQASTGEFASSAMGGNDFQIAQDPLSALNPADIEDITVLKDASATAIYGSRGANGVIIITTKKGKSGKAKVNVTANFTIADARNLHNMLDLNQYASYMNMKANKGEEKYYPQANGEMHYVYGENLDKYKKDPTNPEYYRVLNYRNWQKEAYSSAFSQVYSASVSGGSDAMTYYISAGFKDINGIVSNTGIQQGDLRTNLKAKLSNAVTLSLSLNGSIRQNDMMTGGNTTGGVAGSLARTVLDTAPFQLPADDPQLEANQDAKTTVYSWRDDYDDITNDKSFGGSMDLQWQITKFLTYNLRAGGNVSTNERARWYGMQLTIGANDQGVLAMSNLDKSNYSVENLLNLNLDLVKGIHLGATLGLTYDENHFLNKNVKGTRFTNFDLRTKGMHLASVRDYQQPVQKDYQLLSYLGRINLSAFDKYLLTASVRADGSSKFKKGNRWSYFPSFSLAWRMEQEEFLKDVEFLNQLKLRVGYGVTGNQGINPYATFSDYSQLIDYAQATGDKLLAMGVSNLANDGLKWERTSSWNAGVDFAFFNSRLSGSIDVYQKKTDDLLISRALPASSGFNSVMLNQGSLKNKGFEFSLNADILRNVNGWSWNIGGNFGLNKSEIGDLGFTPTDFGMVKNVRGYQGTTLGDHFGIANLFIVGEAPGLFFGYKTQGIIQPEDIVDGKVAYTAADGSTKYYSSSVANDMLPGNIKTLDLNEDGVVDEKDKTILGNPNPDFTYGFQTRISWKDLSLSASFNGVHGNDILNTNIRYYTPSRQSGNLTQEAFQNIWTEESRSNLFPSATANVKNVVYDRYIEDASYLRCSDITLNYTLPKVWMQKIGFQNVGIFASVKNAFVLTDYSGYDPEVNSFAFDGLRPGIDMNAFPSQRSYVFGLNVAF